ncbi:hypothetical protein CO608_00330 [Lysobacteraceae bacterium NML08-0793]|nr:hypothetical protein CO608_00330 [Xanthomonadaceae bacterium NML08-0793]
MSLPEPAMQSILALPNPKRCEYTMKRIAEAQTLYVLADDEGDWALWADDEGYVALAVWPEMEFAQLALEAEGDTDLSVYELELAPFLEEGIPYLMDNDFGVAIFPLADGSPTVDMPAREFAARINQILDESFGEGLELPYL